MQPFVPSGAFAPLGWLAFAVEKAWPRLLPPVLIVAFVPKSKSSTLQSDWVSCCADWPDTMEM